MISITNDLNATAGGPSCPRGWDLFGESCYHFSDKQSDFEKSYKKCDKHGSELVTIDTEEENDFIQDRM